MKSLLCFILVLIIGVNLIDAQVDTLAISEREIEIHVDDVKISGTLTLPDSENKVPLAILISGSYADNRDAEAWGFKPFKKLTDFFASNGIATFRYDDRGVGKSTGKHTYQYEIRDLADDVYAAIEFFKEEARIDKNQIGLIGHSLGGMMAPMIATESDEVAFIISLAGPVDETDKINLRYREKNLIKAGWKKEDIDKALEIEKRIVDVTVTGIGYDDLMKDIKATSKADYERLPSNHKTRYEDWEDYYAKSWYGIMEPFINTPFMRSFYTFQPKEYLQMTKCPALFIFAEKDGQIQVSYSGPIIIEAMEKAGNNNFTIRQFPKAGHYFVRKWSSPEKSFAPGFLPILTNWINEQSEL